MYRDNRVIAIIAAAGRGKRLGSSLPKQFLKVRGRTILEMSVEAFEQNKYVDEIFVAANADYCELTEKLCRGFSKLKKIVAGGAERQDSVRAALDCLRGENGIVLVHDAARPFVSEAVINAVIEGTADFGAAIPTVPAKDTIRQVDGTGSRTLQRETLACVQTPQGFRISLLKHAFEKAQAEGFLGTDDASLVERMGINISMVQGEDANRKITTREDLETEMRIGTGYDVHRLVEGRPLVLCGEQIPYEKGLLGHSDADVLLHAVSDALLGAAALGDIGKHFPDTDPRYEGADSLMLLREVGRLLDETGYTVGNIDATVLCQAPKLAPHIPAMRQNIANALGLALDDVSVKATTEEHLGFTGEGLGIAAHAVALIEKK